MPSPKNTNSDLFFRPISSNAQPANARSQGKPAQQRPLSQRMFAHWQVVDGELVCRWEWDR